MARSFFGKSRIDTRSQGDPAVAAGMRGIHRDMDGTPIGGYTAEGQAIGTKANASRFRSDVNQSSLTPRLDAGPRTPRLDAMAKPGSSNLQKRQSLFRDMQVAGAGGVTLAMKQQAAALGVKRDGWRNAMGKLPAAPAAIASPTAAPASGAMVTGGVPAALARPAGMAMAAAAPLAGKEKAQADMMKYGVGGAAERFLAANPAKDAEARIAGRDAAKVAAKAALDAVDPRFASQGMRQPAFGQRGGTGVSRFRTAMR